MNCGRPQKTDPGSTGALAGAGGKKSFVGATVPEFFTGIQRDKRNRSLTRTWLYQTQLQETAVNGSLLLLEGGGVLIYRQGREDGG